MDIYCTEDFKSCIEKLRKSNSYKDIEKDTIDFFFSKNPQDISSATNLNRSNDTPYLKKRLNGSGGYRVYYLLIIKDNKAHLMFIHPKTGPQGSDNLKPEAIRELYKKVLSAIEVNNLYTVTCNNEKSQLSFKKVSQPVSPKASSKKK